MRYPTMGETRQYQLALPQMSGGVNYSVLPTLIDDNQLSDVKNLWFRDGVLKTRPGISFDRAVGGTYEKTVFGRYSTDETTLFLSTYTNEQGYKKTGIVFGGDGEVFDISDYTEGREREDLLGPQWLCSRWPCKQAYVLSSQPRRQPGSDGYQ